MSRLAPLPLLVVFLAGCGQVLSPGGSSPGGIGISPPGGFGATPGGVQDMTLARETVAHGRVPPPEALTVEGMFSEHDLPLDGPECDAPLCIRGALGWERDAGWIQLGLSSNVDPDRFERPALTLVLLVDVSGSMGYQYGELGLPARITQGLLGGLIPRFTGSDRVGLATFASSARLVLDFVSGDDRPALEAAVDGLRPGGSTDMEAGLRLAERMLTERRSDGTQKRVLLMTDAQANVGATGPESFLGIARRMASHEIGLTVVGVGIGLNPMLMESMIELRGGNGFSLSHVGAVPEFLDTQWPWMVSPIAYDLVLEAAPGPGFTVTRGYGFPGSEALRAATVFLSRRRGALVVELAGGDFTGFGAGLSLSYETPAGASVHRDLELKVPAGAALDAEGRYFDQSASARSVALALLVQGMQDAAMIYGSNRDRAVEILARAQERFASDAEAIHARDPGSAESLDREGALAEALLALMRENAPQESFYGGF